MAATPLLRGGRRRQVLQALIREYIDSAEPVGSRLLRGGTSDLSPATIRNAMADLEEMGYLAQPHTSAGRVPTDKAYRFYVESFPRPSPPASRWRPAARSGVWASTASWSGLLAPVHGDPDDRGCCWRRP